MLLAKLALYDYMDILAFNAMGGREKGREGTLEKCGELYFSVGCSLNVTKTRSGYSQTPLSWILYTFWSFAFCFLITSIHFMNRWIVLSIGNGKIFVMNIYQRWVATLQRFKLSSSILFLFGKEMLCLYFLGWVFSARLVLPDIKYFTPWFIIIF